MSSTKSILRTALVAFALLVPPVSGMAGEAFDAAPAIDPESGPEHAADFAPGSLLGEAELARQRGGDVHLNQNTATAVVEGNIASNLSTGNNTISDSAFANANGVPMVVQNSGNNVVIQNSTILNLQLK